MKNEHNTLHDTIQGIKIEDLINTYDTPLYVYDAEIIIRQLKNMQTAFADCQIRVKYAMKALSNISILKLLKKNGSGVDAVSINEVKIALHAGFKPVEVLFTPNSVAIEEIMEAVELGVTINIDSLSTLQEFGAIYGSTYPCCIRLNPHIQAGGHYKISTGHIEAKFGISVFQLGQIKQLTEQYHLRIIGLHIHSGSEIAESDVYLKMANILFDVAKDFPDLQFLDFGGGFKVGYKPDDLATNIFELGLKLGKAFTSFCEAYGKKLELYTEPGKYLVSESGYLITRCTLVKSTPSVTFVGVNSGLNHLIRPMMYDAWHDIVNITNPHGVQKIYTIVGNICETDTFGSDRKLNEVRQGDVLVIKNAGAYGYSMASQYNSRLRPAEVLIEKGKAKLIRRRETLDDLLLGQVT